MRFAALVLIAVFLSACSVANQTADEIARQQAKSVIGNVLQQQAGGADVSIATDCIIDNASAGEILTLAKAAVTGVTAETVTLVLDITQRLDTVRCITNNSLRSLTL